MPRQLGKKEVVVEWKPGKGAFLPLNEDMLDWFQQVFEGLWNAAGGKGELNELLDNGNANEFFKSLVGTDHGWKYEIDSFGEKLYQEIAWGEDARGTKIKYRVTVVLKNGKLSLDIRQWYWG